jgi:hypothetical protein
MKEIPMSATYSVPCNTDPRASIPGERWIFREYTRRCDRCKVTHPAGLRVACGHDTWVYEIPAGYVYDVTTDFADPYDVWTAREQASQDQAERERESAALDRQLAIAGELLAKARKRIIYKAGGSL